MSYTIYFFRKRESDKSGGVLSSVRNILGGTSIAGNLDKEMLRFLSQFGHFPGPEPVADGFDAGYLNLDTGTQFFLNLHRSQIPELENEVRFPGYEFTGLTCTMNCCRPLYFMLEAAPVIEKIARKFNLEILNDTDLHKASSPRICMAHELIMSYEKANTTAVREMAKSMGNGSNEVLSGTDPRNYLPPEKTMFWWEYMFNRDDIRAQLEEHQIELYVPELMVMKRKSDGELLTMMALSEGVGYLMPPSDMFYILRNNDTEEGFIIASDLLQHLGPYLIQTTILNKTFNVLSTEKAKEFAQTLKQIPLMPVSGMFTGVQPGNFVDVR
jgi:hypothetical protein